MTNTAIVVRQRTLRAILSHRNVGMGSEALKSSSSGYYAESAPYSALAVYATVQVYVRA
jgi:hypothetical protein